MKLSFGKKRVVEVRPSKLLEVAESDKQPPPSVVSLIDQVLDKREHLHPPFFRPSMVFDCDRKNVYHYLQVKQEGTSYGAKLQRILDTGTKLHELLQGYLAQHEGIFFVPEVKVSATLGERNAFIQGSCDGLIIRRSDGHKSVLEIKTIAPKSFETLKAPIPKHIGQAMIYARLLGVYYVTFLYFDKGGQAFKEFVVPADDARWDAFVERLDHLKDFADKGKLPMYNKSTCSTDFCRYVEQCRKDGGLSLHACMAAF